MKLSKITKREDLRCVIVEDETKKIGIYHNETDKILETLKSIDNVENISIVKVFNPDVDIRMKIMDMLIKNLKVEGDKVDIVIPNVDFVYELLTLLTDVEMDLDINNKEDKIELAKIVADPSDFLRTVFIEITNISDHIFFELIENIKKTDGYPEELKKLMLEVENLNSTAKKIKQDITPSPKKKTKKSKLIKQEDKSVEDK